MLLSEGLCDDVDLNSWFIKSSINRNVALDEAANVDGTTLEVWYKSQNQQELDLVSEDFVESVCVDRTLSFITDEEKTHVGVDEILFTVVGKVTEVADGLILFTEPLCIVEEALCFVEEALCFVVEEAL